MTAIIYIGLILYQKCFFQAVADQAAERAAKTWNSSFKDPGTGKIREENLRKDGLYRRILDIDKNMKCSRVVKLAEARLGKGNIVHGTGSKVEIDIEDYVIYRKITVHIKSMYELPLGSVLEVFGQSRFFSIEARSHTVVAEPAEFIRNTDFVLDIEGELESKFPALKNLGGKTRDVLKDIKDKIDEILK